jgi:hypothetical protein
MVPQPWHHVKCGGHCTPAVAAVVAILLLLATVAAISLQLAAVAPLSIFNCSPVNNDAVEAKMTASCFIYPPPISRCFFHWLNSLMTSALLGHVLNFKVISVICMF